ncbi:GAF domain-containing sensor histidine kinase [Calditerrivibrio nitroreducens]|uniref:histidine kinase n=1 Tax=Calditerrivibrio nitroreducens (strain DSM 19672 / NBRC 101217 / Yu37-1) TaxID=768670 RepID=E4THU5_CALNY|nr:GAF domain-containing sensor histidine kinase [Calditerrivibrio nitroreducens]ADR19956.1 GAF sensor signal transduction histidine kinase [Calditerrivibrio nitroreducens DSM 19672]
MKKDLLDILVEISEKMASTLKEDELLNDILEIAQEYLSVKRISIMIIEGDHLVIKAAVGLHVDYKSLKVPLGNGISGKVAITGEPIVINKGSNTNWELGYDTKSYMSVPLRIKDKLIGVLNLTDKENDYFSDDDIKIAKYIASQCAISIEKAQIYESIRRSENLQLIGKFTSTIIHDIKNLLNIVQNYVELLEIASEDESDFKEYVDSIYTELKLIHGLVMDILDFSKNQITLKTTRIELDDFMEYITKHTNIMLKPYNIDFYVDYPKGIIFYGDKDKLFRVLFNLINNAVDAVGENGQIKLKVLLENNSLIFIVEDNGKGIPTEMVDRIFDPFYTAGKEKGTGLGLAVVKDIVNAHNGTIAVESKVGEYTKFLIRLPISG